MLGGAAEVQTPNVKSNVVPIRPAGSSGARPAKAPAVQPRKPRLRKQEVRASSGGGGRSDKPFSSLFQEFIEKALQRAGKGARSIGFPAGTTEEMQRAVHVELAWWKEIEGYDLDDAYDEKFPDTPESARVYCLDALEILLDPLVLHEGDADEWIASIDEYFDKLRRFASKAVPPPSREAMARWAVRWERSEFLQREVAKHERGIEAAREELKAIAIRWGVSAK